MSFYSNKRNVIKLLFAALLLLCLIGASLFFYSANLIAGIITLILPIAILFIATIFLYPRFGFLAAFVANYFALGVARYLPAPLGLLVDGLLLLTWLSVFFSQFNKKVEWRKARNGLTIVAIIWYAYALFQLFNPQAVSIVAWFYAMRGFSLYMLLTAPLVFLVFNKKENMEQMLKLWAWFTLAAVFKGVMQHTIGPDPWEQHWLSVIGGKTHILPQGLRIFSFFPDASIYGGSMGFSGIVFLIIAMYTPNTLKKIFYLIVGFSAFYAMLISGTRGAIAVPFAGIALYAILSKKVKMLILGSLICISVFVILKYTTIGNSVYEIRRFRGGLEADNPSLVVRKENKKLLKAYLADKPFGGGIGSAANWGMRFSPGTFLAETPTDSWYVQIWAEQGRVGLFLHISILIYILSHCSWIIMFKLKSIELKGKASALLAGMFGVMAASYSSGALGQLPNGIIIYTSMAFIFMMPEWEKTLESNETSTKT
ncbi:MAG: hypothetical protein JEZ09_11685 [Salinivirgaceae bacterium]|nr:hypothetical protein [Salinivirgaceae bacterium]